jgi:fibronectin type 3 domain-containing protein
VTVSAGDGAVTLSWNPASRAEGYNLYWDITAGVSRETGTLISAVSTPYVHSGLSNGRSYYYVVTSWNANGESAESAEVGATPLAPVPGAPKVTSTSPSNGATGIGVNSSISVTFATAMNNPATEAAFSISPSVTGSFAWAGAAPR